MLGEIGTLAWTRRTNGLLSRSERARYIAATVRETARRAPSLTAWRLGRDGKGEIGEDSLKLPPTVGPEQGTEAHLLHDGVLLDAVGLRAWELKREAIERVRARHPRLRFSQEGGRLLGEQAKAVPRCRTAAVMQAGFGLALRLSPWRD